jgi:thioredoxin reductase
MILNIIKEGVIMLDVIIVGGSSAGLSAALVLGRSRRNVVVFDDSQPCNRFSHASHGFLTRDGIAPSELVQIGREQLGTYPNVEVRADTVSHITPVDGGFNVETASGNTVTARKVLLATGIKDILPPVKNMEQFWGTSVFHCPYCDGWEVRDEAIVVYGGGENAFHKTMLLWNWSPNLTFCTGGEGEIPAEKRALFEKNGITVIETPVSHVEGQDGQVDQIVFTDGTTLNCKAIFIQPAFEHRTPFAQDLGCVLTPQNFVQADTLGRTNVPGLYAAGDLTAQMRSVALAVAQGSSAGAGINYDLIVEDFYS